METRKARHRGRERRRQTPSEREFYTQTNTAAFMSFTCMSRSARCFSLFLSSHSLSADLYLYIFEVAATTIAAAAAAPSPATANNEIRKRRRRNPWAQREWCASKNSLSYVQEHTTMTTNDDVGGGVNARQIHTTKRKSKRTNKKKLYKLWWWDLWESDRELERTRARAPL